MTHTPRNAPETAASSFPVVGLGCSAGGLEAVESFLHHVPINSGLAYVVIQHLDPDRTSTLADLLQRVTPMPVVQVTDGLAVQPDCVYVIPPNQDLSLLHGRLQLLEPTERRGLRLAVDFFLRTLAEDRHDLAVGVILSGMGSDGMLGMRTIKECGGLAVVQDPTEAKAPSMPQSAIATGLIDIVAPAAQLPGRILDYLRRAPRPAGEDSPLTADNGSGLEKVVILLRDRCGADFSLYKSSTLYRRIERRIALHQLAGIGDYVTYLRENPQELDLLFKELLIGVTNFFRDGTVWDTLRQEIFPALFARHTAGRALRAWVPACSSGEEAYSLAITFREALEQVQPRGRFSLQIYATDLDPDAIARARKGSYPKNIAADVSPERLARHFVADDEGYRVGKEIRDMVVFAPQNIIADPPFTRLDLLSCRNLLIYFRAELQKKLLPLFHYALNPEGFLILGSAETIGSFSHLFAATDMKGRLFRRLEQSMPLSSVSLPSRLPVALPGFADLPMTERNDSVEQLTDQLIQQSYAPAAVLVNADGDILYISGRTGKYLEPAAGKVNINIHAMARDGLRDALPGVIHKALRQPEPVQLNGIRVGTNGGTQIINVIVQGLENPEALRGRVLIVFEDVATPPARRRKGKTGGTETPDIVMQELLQTREALRITHEEMQSSLEELKSSNEELQSTNEELQSTNEELTTSKEEMQSLNEELQTVNAELQSKVDDLTWERNDMTNLLNSTEIATVFLDNQMKLRRFTAHATRLFKLIPGDVGRPLSDVVNDLDYPQLIADAQEVLASLVFAEKQVATRDGRWYRVRIMPYRTQDNVIDGVVATFIDITEIKKLEAGLRSHGEA
jgi:chemotaxis methyl-accepting protein methylase